METHLTPDGAGFHKPSGWIQRAGMPRRIEKFVCLVPGLGCSPSGSGTRLRVNYTRRCGVEHVLARGFESPRLHFQMPRHGKSREHASHVFEAKPARSGSKDWRPSLLLTDLAPRPTIPDLAFASIGSKSPESPVEYGRELPHGRGWSRCGIHHRFQGEPATEYESRNPGRLRAASDPLEESA